MKNREKTNMKTQLNSHRNGLSTVLLLTLTALPCLGGATGKLQPSRQADYDFYTIDPEGHGHAYIDAHGINNARQVVVDWSPDGSVNHASLWSNGQWTLLDYVDPNRADRGTYLTSLNERGLAFGTFWTGSTDWSVTDYEPAAFVDVSKGAWVCLPDVPDYPYNQGLSMNNSGRAVGAAWNDAYENKHWIWDGKQYLYPIYPDDWDVSGFWAGPEFINDAGQIAGQYVDVRTGLMRGFFQHGSQLATFEAPGNPSGGTYINGITESGDVLLIGIYLEPGSTYYPAHSFLWSKGSIIPLPNVPFAEATWTFVFGINDRGDHCGRWVDQDGLSHAFVAFRK
jgi:hypothetical protein